MGFPHFRNEDGSVAKTNSEFLKLTENSLRKHSIEMLKLIGNYNEIEQTYFTGVKT